MLHPSSTAFAIVFKSSTGHQLILTNLSVVATDGSTGKSSKKPVSCITSQRIASHRIAVHQWFLLNQIPVILDLIHQNTVILEEWSIVTLNYIINTCV